MRRDLNFTSNVTAFDEIQEGCRSFSQEAERGNLEGITKAYQADPRRLQTENAKGQRPLHVAAVKGHLDIVQFLIKEHADLDATDCHGDTALHCAVQQNHPQIVEALLQAGADDSILNESHMAPLHIASDKNFVEIVEVMAKHPDIDLNIGGAFGMTPLHYCSFKDSAECAKIILKKGGTPCMRCNLGYFAIHVAAKSAAARTLEVLIQLGSENGYDRATMLAFKDKENNMPLHAAVNGGNIKAVEVCLRAGAPVNAQQDDNSTPVHFAAAQGNLAMIQLMFSQQADNFVTALKATDTMDMTPLHRAAIFNHKAVVIFLLDKGADIDSTDNTGCTPLLLAASKGCWDTVQVLVGRGADVTVRDFNSRNFLHLAIRFGGKLEEFFMKRESSGLEDSERASDSTTTTTNHELQQQQTPNGEDSMTKKSQALDDRRRGDLYLLLNEMDENGCTPMHYASKTGHLFALEELIKLGAAPSLKNKSSQSPFHYACRYGRYNTCRRLLDLAQGPNIMNEMDCGGLTGLHIAAQNGHTKIITLLLKKGAVINKDNDDNTPLHHAAAEGWTQCMRILLAIHSHLLNVKNINGETALHVAAQRGQSRTVSLLLTMEATLEGDKEDKTFLDYIIELKLCDVAFAVIKHDRWEEVLRIPSVPYLSPFMGFIEHMPLCCEAVLDRCEVTSNHDKKSPKHYIEYNFKFLNCSNKFSDEANEWKEPMMALNAMVRHGRVNCISHTVCVNFLKMKWNTYGRWFYLLLLGIYVLYLASLTYFVVENDSFRHHDSGSVSNKTFDLLGGNSSNSEIGPFSRVTIWIVAVCSVLSMMKEVIQMITQGVRYFGDYHNVYEWTLYITSLLFASPFLLGHSYHWQWGLGAFTIFLAWFNLLVMLQRFDFFGIYVVMFLEILRTLLHALCVFSILIIAFGLAFYILLHRGGTKAYHTPGLSILRAAMMMLELDYLSSFNAPFTDGDDSTLHFPGITFFMVVIFVILMPILLMNLLIGLAVGDIESVQRNARLKRLAKQVDVHTDMERKMPAFLLGRLHHCSYRYYPNSCKSKIDNVSIR
ncbi:hypothetical protein ACOMHN_025356 [Nucella lapillus]